MGWLDLIPRANKLYIGGLHALYQQPALFKEAGITHIISVLDFDIYEAGAFSQYQHMHIKQDDDPNEDLLQHFATTNAFIADAFRNGGAVFVHCAMGKSRSATICCAYLMWKAKEDGMESLTPDQALMQVCEGRPVCDPNPGFKSQLIVYRKMLEAGSEEEAEGIYKEWVEKRYKGDWWSWDKRFRESKL